MNKDHKIKKNDHFNIYKYDYKVSTLSIPIDFELGVKMQNLGNPNALLNDVISQHNVFSIYSDGSKTAHNSFVAFAAIYPETDLKISKSLDKDTSIFTAESATLNEAMNIVI